MLQLSDALAKHDGFAGDRALPDDCVFHVAAAPKHRCPSWRYHRHDLPPCASTPGPAPTPAGRAAPAAATSPTSTTATLSRKGKRTSLALHEANDVFAAAHREAVAATREVRELARERRQRKAAEERQRFIDQIVGAGYREAQAKAGRQRQRGAVAGFVKLFAKERRNDFSAEAIAAVLDSRALPGRGGRRAAGRAQSQRRLRPHHR